MAVINLIGKTMGGQDKRSKITKIARHHSATSTGNTFTFEDYWKNHHGWKTGGYHEVILPNGDVQLCYDSDVVTNGVYGHNQTTYHICMVGNRSFTAAQERAFGERAENAIKRFGLSVNDILGHNEFGGASTACPGIDMDTVRDRLRGETVASTPPKKQTGSTTASKPKANLTVDGKWAEQTTRALQVALKTVVDGKLSGQLRNAVTNAMYGNTVQLGSGGSLVIKALQRLIGARADGLLGPATIRALQVYLGTVRDGKLSRPSLVVKELQRRLNKGKL